MQTKLNRISSKYIKINIMIWNFSYNSEILSTAQSLRVKLNYNN